ncbi:unnamed protein product, partial [Nesidiocoris tenuis]
MEKLETSYEVHTYIGSNYRMIVACMPTIPYEGELGRAGFEGLILWITPDGVETASVET